MPSATVLLLGSDPASTEAIRSTLQRAGYELTVTDDPDRALNEGVAYDLIIVDTLIGMQTAVDVVRDIRATPALAGVALLAVAPRGEVEERIQFLETGADEVVTRPIDGRELEARVEAVMVRFERSKAMAPAVLSSGPPRRAEGLIALFSPKGGSGTTTAAVNIATSLAAQRPDRIAIFDLDLQWGQVATHLDLRPRHTIVDLTQDEHVLSEPELLRTYAERHDSSLSVFPAPDSPDQVGLVQSAHVARILGGARSVYDAVIVDAGSVLDERTLTVFELADTLILVVNPEIGSIKAMHSLLELSAEAGGLNAHTVLVVNHVFPKDMVSTKDIESTLSTKVSHELLYDPLLYLRAVNEGVPLVTGAPKSAPARAFEALAASLLASGSGASASSDGRQKRGLAGLIRRG